MYRSLLTLTHTSGSYPCPAVARWRRGGGGGGEGGADMAAEFGYHPAPAGGYAVPPQVFAGVGGGGGEGGWGR